MLSDIVVRSAKSREKPYTLNDVYGLRLLVQPSGSKLWQMRYSFDKSQRLVSFGPYPIVTLAVARAKTLEARRLLNDGVDPSDHKKAAEAPEWTFELVARLWHENRRATLNNAHEQRVIARLERDAFPQIGSRGIGEIEAPEILHMVRKVEARGALDIAKRLRQTCGQIFRFAIASGWAKRDPSADLRGALKPSPRVRHMPRLPLADLPSFLHRLENYQGEELTRLAIRFTLLTWVRTSETRFARWEEFHDIDGDRPTWRIPAVRMKMHRPHVIPLSTQAVAVFKRLMEMRRSEYVFPHDRKAVLPASENMMISALYRMGYRGRLTIHGFRGMASTWANEMLRESGDRLYHEDWIELQLAHADNDGVRSAYNAAEYLAPRTRMLQDWGDFIDGQIPNDFDALLLA